jgi:hypothetical protein
LVELVAKLIVRKRVGEPAHCQVGGEFVSQGRHSHGPRERAILVWLQHYVSIRSILNE